MTSTSNTHPVPADVLYNDLGPAYETAFAGLPEQAEAIHWLISQLSASTTHAATILDVGCGTGRPVCSALTDAGHNVLGIDISTEMLQAARARVPKASFEQQDVRTFDKPENTYDAITQFFTLLVDFTKDDIRYTIRKFHQWLKPGGYLVFATVPIEGNNYEFKWMGRQVRESSLSTEEVLAFAEKIGFEVVYHKESHFTPKAVEAGICGPDDVWEEPHLFIYARKSGKTGEE